jgi:hypothetical protein
MAYSTQEGIDLSFVAGEDLRSYQYRFVHLADDNTVDLLDSGSEFPIGILQNAPNTGGVAVVRIMGVSKLAMNAAVTVGSPLKAEYVSASDNGKGDAADTDGDYMRAICLQAAGAEDDVGSVLLMVDKMAIVSSPSASVSASPSASVSASPS